VKSGQDKERQKNEGEAYANDVIPRARGTASRLIEEANAYRERVVASAEGEASRFSQILTEYGRAPEVTRERMYLETMQEVISKSSKVMVDAKGSGNLLMLPLDKLIQAAGAAPRTAGEQAATPVPAASSPAPAFDPRDREQMRNRERGER
jgi:membrane protease subunit HflK